MRFHRPHRRGMFGGALGSLLVKLGGGQVGSYTMVKVSASAAYANLLGVVLEVDLTGGAVTIALPPMNPGNWIAVKIKPGSNPASDNLTITPVKQAAP